MYEFSEIKSDQYIPITPLEDGEQQEPGTKYILSILPIKNTVLFPGVVIPITVSRHKSVKLVKKAYKGDKTFGVIAQKNNSADNPGMADIYKVGTAARILKLLVLPNGNTTIIIQGKEKFRLNHLITDEPYLKGEAEILADEFGGSSTERKSLMHSLKEAAHRILDLNPDIPQEAQVALENIENPSFLTHFLASNISTDVKDKQGLLEIKDGQERAAKLLDYMQKEIQALELRHEIHSKVHLDIDQQQRDFYLRQQMKVLQDELGMEGSDQEIESLRQKAANKKWPENVQKHFYKELSKIGRLNPASPEYPIAINYCEFMVELPWNQTTQDSFDLGLAQKILDKDHYGLEKVKERIIEYLAVLKLKQNMRGPILCLYGPPGVGKTSLGRSISKALGRKYVRMSLGGLHDEAEIRGHRKTYIGAMPGKILQQIKKTACSNPVFILDEIDKIGNDFRGDPASAFLEVLDPEQNHAFVDNYLELDYDLSKVLFIATANSLDSIHPALRDRMEIIEINGYTLEEKMEIAKKYLFPKQRAEHGLKSKDITIAKEGYHAIIEGYTRESGVRDLERKIGALVRRTAKYVAMEQDYKKSIKAKEVEEVLGSPIFEKELYQDNRLAGVVTGLAWTPVGGEILFIEASLSRGKGKLILSGKLGDVMKESATAALSYLKANADSLSIQMSLFDKFDLHVHVPAGAVPKDGPSAGITMLTAMASIFTQRKVKNKLAMTGEITLRGKVLPVGGIKEKLLAAKRAGIEEIIFSERNQKDVDEVDKRYVEGLSIRYVKVVDEVLEIALLSEIAERAIDFAAVLKDD